jgi:hypothetical protein
VPQATVARRSEKAGQAVQAAASHTLGVLCDRLETGAPFGKVSASSTCQLRASFAEMARSGKFIRIFTVIGVELPEIQIWKNEK